MMHVDVLGLLAAAVALTLYPGGLFLAAGGWLAATVGGIRNQRGSAAGWSPAQLTAPILLTAAAALVPLAGSPAVTLPAGTGAPSSLLAFMLLVAAAFGLTSSGATPAPKLVAGLSAGLPLLLLASAGASFALPVAVGLPGGSLVAARLLAAAALALAAPLLGEAADAAQPPLLRGLRLATLALLVSVLLPSAPAAAPAGAAVAMATVLVVGAMARPLTRATALVAGGLAALAASAATASIVLAALALRG